MREQVITTFQVDSLHSLLTATRAIADIMAEKGRKLVDIPIQLEDLGASWVWVKLVETQRNHGPTFYHVAIHKSEA